MRALFVIFVLFSFTKILLVSCTKEKVPVIIDTFLTSDCPDTVFYKDKIKPIIDLNCTTSSCHDGVSKAGGYDLTTYSKVAAQANEILKSIDASQNPAILMPLGLQPLDSIVIQDFKCWISQGKLNN